MEEIKGKEKNITTLPGALISDYPLIFHTKSVLRQGFILQAMPIA
jgi:hypothetical protein